MIPISEAKEIITRNTSLLKSEVVDLSRVVGRVLAEDIFADMNVPPFDRSQMDGFAVKTTDVENAPVTLKIVGESVAGKGWNGKVNSGEAVRIMTGASVPVGTDAVQKVELTQENNGFITIQKSTAQQQNIVKRAAEVAKNTKVFEQGEIVSENMISTLASFGYEKVRVAKRPKVAVLATGSEIVEISETPKQDQIRNSNSWMLQTFAKNYADVSVLPITHDDLTTLKNTINDAVSTFDVLVISGGVSVGDYDFTKPALREIGAKIFFEKVSLKPGKPTVFAKLNDTLIFGLPGNPVSAAVTYFAFVQMALLKLQDAKDTQLKEGFAILAHGIKATKGRDALLPVSLSSTRKGQLNVETLRFSGSSNFITFAKANALVFVPRDRSLEKNDIARILFL